MDEQHAHYGYIQSKDDYLKRLRRIEGQARGLQRMVEDEKYCIDILTQVSAMTKALQSVALGLLDDHLSHCVVEAAAAGGPEADAKVKEAAEAISRLVRSEPATPVLSQSPTFAARSIRAGNGPPRTLHEGRDPMSTSTFTVTGMTCGHCVRSVSEEVSEIPGVLDVQVDLDTGRLTVTSSAPLEESAVRGAVEGAGYQLAAA